MIPGGGTMPSNRWNRELPLTQPKTAENILWLRLAATGFRAGPNSRPLLDAHRLTSDRVRSDVAWRELSSGVCGQRRDALSRRRDAYRVVGPPE
jgi:hypothetical protein